MEDIARIDALFGRDLTNRCSYVNADLLLTLLYKTADFLDDLKSARVCNVRLYFDIKLCTR